MFYRLALAGVAALALGACTQTGNTERSALTGGVLGAAAGAVIGNNTGSGDARTGAIIGGVVGASAGAYVGCREDGGCRWNQNNQAHSELYYDQQARRYYYVNSQDRCTYWQTGERRSC